MKVSFLVGLFGSIALFSVIVCAVAVFILFRQRQKRAKQGKILIDQIETDQDTRKNSLAEQLKALSGADGEALKKIAEALFEEKSLYQTFALIYAKSKHDKLMTLTDNVQAITTVVSTVQPVQKESEALTKITAEKEALAQQLEADKKATQDFLTEIQTHYHTMTKTEAKPDEAPTFEMIRELIKNTPLTTLPAADVASEEETEHTLEINLTNNAEMEQKSQARMDAAKESQNKKLQEKLMRTTEELTRATQLLNTIFKEYAAMFSLDTGGRINLTVDEIQAILEKE